MAFDGEFKVVSIPLAGYGQYSNFTVGYDTQGNVVSTSEGHFTSQSPVSGTAKIWTNNELVVNDSFSASGVSGWVGTASYLDERELEKISTAARKDPRSRLCAKAPWSISPAIRKGPQLCGPFPYC